MTLSTSIKDNEANKFREVDNGTAIAVVESGFFSTNDLDDSLSPVTYIGKSNGITWQVIKLDEAVGLQIRYADIVNNISTTNYNDAWTNRLTLTYSLR